MSSILSIDIGSHNIHMVEGSFNKGIVNVSKMETFATPVSAFNGETVIDEALLTETIINSINTFKSTSKEVILTINATNAVVRDIDLPIGKPKELDQMIKNELYQTYHVLPTDIIQYKMIDRIEGTNGQILNRYRAATLDEEIVDTYRQMIVKTKLRPIALDININAVDKLFSMEMEINNKILNGTSTMAIDFGGKSSTIYIFSKGKPVFFRHLNIGSEQIENILQEETFTAKEDIKKMKETGLNFFLESESSEKYFNILRQYFYNLNDELRKIMGLIS